MERKVKKSRTYFKYLQSKAFIMNMLNCDMQINKEDLKYFKNLSPIITISGKTSIITDK